MFPNIWTSPYRLIHIIYYLHFIPHSVLDTCAYSLLVDTVYQQLTKLLRFSLQYLHFRSINWHNEGRVSYVYWTVHHLDSWIKRDQLDVTCFIISLFTGQHVLEVNTSILKSLRLIWWVISWVVLFWFDVCWCYVVVWLGWCGIDFLYKYCLKHFSL